MIRALKQTYLLFLALSLTLVLADCGFMGNTFSHQINDNHRECPENSGIAFHLNSVCFEDEVFMNDSIGKPASHCNVVALVPDLTINFKSYNNTTIWQPPKLS
jgi:hypothetical protein